MASLENHRKGSVADETCFVELVISDLLHISYLEWTIYTLVNYLAIISGVLYAILNVAHLRNNSLYYAISAYRQKVSHSCFCFLCDQTTASCIRLLEK